ncbi:hypothetical protein AD31_3601 [Escherichia coli 2-427-07_S4_C3]|nr:hypothetical protein AD31_3601 [Escherichia coli 2-427-07_S4_C3]
MEALPLKDYCEIGMYFTKKVAWSVIISTAVLNCIKMIDHIFCRVI